jgi:hypothetical protein
VGCVGDLFQLWKERNFFQVACVRMIACAVDWFLCLAGGVICPGGAHSACGSTAFSCVCREVGLGLDEYRIVVEYCDAL